MPRFLAALIALCITLGLPLAGAAQDRAWVQIESQPTLAQAEARARGYATVIEGVNGFALPTGWYTLTIGPFDEADAETTLRRLRAQGVIPRDSFVSDGRDYGARFWPLGAGAPPRLTAPAVPGPAPALDTAPPVDETLRQAQASERGLNREERRDLQRALAWFGHYTAGIDGAFGRGTRAAMASWQDAQDLPPTGVLTTRQRARILSDWRTAQAALGLEPLRDLVAGITVEAPMGLVAFDRYEAPFAYYSPRRQPGPQMILISQPGDRGTMNGLFEILQTLDIVPTEGSREKLRGGFTISGQGTDRSTEVRVRLRDGHIHGFLLTWTPDVAVNMGHVARVMEATLSSTGQPMPPGVGFEPENQSIDMVSGLQVRRPQLSRSGVFVDDTGRVLTSPEIGQAGCGRITLDQVHEAQVAAQGETYTLLRPLTPLAPMATAQFAPEEARLRSSVAVGGFPFEGVLGAATLTFGTLEDMRGLNGETDVQRLSLIARPGDAGGPVFDETGAVTGLLLPNIAPNRLLPPGVAFAKRAGALRDLLRAQGVAVQVSTSEDALPPEDLTLRAAQITVLVSCWP